MIFLNWRLDGSLPVARPDILNAKPLGHTINSRKSAVPLNAGPFWLQDCRIAAMIANALEYGETTRQFYRLYAWVIMPNHVHAVLQPNVELAVAMR